MSSTVTSSNASQNEKGTVEGRGSKGSPVSKWLPVTLLAFTTVALAVPLVILKRQRSNMLTKTLGKGPENAPPRRTGAGTIPPLLTTSVPKSASSLSEGPPVRRSSIPSTPSIASSSSTPSAASPISTAKTSGASVSPNEEDDFNYALYSAKAFGIATLLVSVGAMATVGVVQYTMGVKDAREFGDRMRNAVLSRMPVLSSRIHRTPDAEDHGHDPELLNTLSSNNHEQQQLPTEEWTWNAAENRLREAFDKDGFSGWGLALLQELEAEGRVEREKRGHA
ncbi:hypothetical protein C8Q75DRAFT_781180 [Abortiporus biennis]|nr:hypothetical protein C8Q75DRAFT_781180 [Abortiporus biennis]